MVWDGMGIGVPVPVKDSIVEATEPHLSASDQVRNLNRGQMEMDGHRGAY